MDVKKAIMAITWIQNEYPGIAIEMDDERLRAMELIMTIDTVEHYYRLLLTCGLPLVLGLQMWYSHIENYESAVKISQALDAADRLMELDLPRELSDPRLEQLKTIEYE